MFIIGSDAGTSSLKVIIFNETGTIISEVRKEYPLMRPNPGWVEQKAEWWWEAFCYCCKEAIEKAKIDPKDIIGVGITHQRQTFVSINKDMKVIRSAILWNDTRCSEQVEWARRNVGEKNVYSHTGFPPGTMTIYKTMWIRDNEPEIYEATYKFLLVQDYLIYKLANEIVATSSSISFAGCLDINNISSYATFLFDALNLSIDKWPSQLLTGGKIAGVITKEASNLTGILQGTPVVTTGGDQPCGSLGVGAIEPGMLAVNGGTSCTAETFIERPILSPNMNYFIEVAPLGGFLPEAAIYSGVSALMKWYKDNFGFAEIEESKSKNKNIWEVIYSKAYDAPVGNIGLVLIPYYNGASAPYWDLRARGVIAGLLENHGRPHIIRAIIESQAYETRKMAELISADTMVALKEIRMYGGSMVSDIWNQTFSDCLNMKVVTNETAEATSLGAAICAAVGVGLYKDDKEAVRNMVRIKKEYDPYENNYDLYTKYYEEVYKSFYDKIQTNMHASSVISNYP
jgi:xylulokinase